MYDLKVGLGNIFVLAYDLKRIFLIDGEDATAIGRLVAKDDISDFKLANFQSHVLPPSIYLLDLLLLNLLRAALYVKRYTKMSFNLNKGKRQKLVMFYITHDLTTVTFHAILWRNSRGINLPAV